MEGRAERDAGEGPRGGLSTGESPNANGAGAAWTDSAPYDSEMPPSPQEPATPRQVAAAFRREAEEERQHLLRDGIISIAVGLVGCALLIFAVPIITALPFARRMSISFLSGAATTIALFVLLFLVGSFIYCWLWMKPLQARLPSRQDPRFGPPKIDDPQADDDAPDPGASSLGQLWVVREAMLAEHAATIGSRQIVLGIASLAERTRLADARLELAAAILVQSAAGRGITSQELPSDIETLLALTFLWRYRYIRAEGILSKRRLTPTEKGREVLRLPASVTLGGTA